jgi:hypothetical protein
MPSGTGIRTRAKDNKCPIAGGSPSQDSGTSLRPSCGDHAQSCDGRALTRSPTLPHHERRGRKARLRVNPEQSPAFMPGIRGVYKGLQRPCRGHGGMFLVWARKAVPRAPIGKGPHRQGRRALTMGEPVDRFLGFGGLGAASEPCEGDLDRSREQKPFAKTSLPSRRETDGVILQDPGWTSSGGRGWP